MRFELNNGIRLDEILRAEYINEDGSISHIVKSHDDYVDSEYLRVKQIVEKYIDRLNSVEKIFDVDNLTKCLLKCESDNMVFIKIKTSQNTVLDATRTICKTIFRNDYAKIYYPYTYTSIAGPFGLDGNYLIVYDEYLINLLSNLVSDFDSRLELPNKESVIKFITDIGVSVAMLKETINIEPSCNYYWEKLECIVNLKTIMNKAINLLEEL